MVGRTPKTSLEEIFRRAASALDDEEEQSEVVAEALGYLQQGFDAHYAKNGAGATDDDILVGDNAYAWAVETIARLDEPRFVAVASRMIRDGAGEISAGNEVRLDLWVPHLADLLRIISGEDSETARACIRKAADELQAGREAL
ncbi:MAG: hypothetical protein M3N10_07495 [Actinomycetota bacterium]|nr:hypothetical protein [Actinomycetota bacterium]